MNLPVVQFVDVPGYAIGTVAERNATMRWGVELAKTYFATTTPIFNVITRRAYGVAGGIMLGARDPVVQVAWPSGNWGSLPLDGGIEVGHRQELREAEQRGGKEGKAARYKELEDEYLRLMNPVRTANAFGVQEIVDPKDTRKICYIVPIVMAGILGIYGLVVSVLIANTLSQKAALYTSLVQLGAGLSAGLCGLAAGFAIGIVGDAGVRGTAQQPRLYVGMILILIFTEVLGGPVWLDCGSFDEL
ncbi:hypothetical protein CNMCM8060_005540 [Aspergillus lentulus]|nr:hypothetical protein CNMCM8060_005540 [Aspergillus lentulus]